VEDAAQAVGASRGSLRAGAVGVAGCFSFHPSKNLSAAGDGGAVTTSDSALADAIRLRRQLGQQTKNVHVTIGLNSKLDAIQAAVLAWKLPNLDSWNLARRRVAAKYRERLAGLPLYFQSHNPDVEIHVFHLFQVGCSVRDRLLDHLRTAGIDAVIRYPTPIHLQTAFQDLGWKRGEFPIAERLATELLCLPIRPDLNEDEVDIVCNAIREFFGIRAWQ